MEILSYVPMVMVDASEWQVEELQDIASASSNSKFFIKNTKHLSSYEIEQIIKVKGDIARKNHVAIDL